MANPFDNVPAQPTDPGITAQNEWIAKYMNPAFDAWLSTYQSVLSAQGFEYRKTDDNRGATPNAYVMPSYVVLNFGKNNVYIDRAITFGVARQTDPTVQANSDIQNLWGYQYAIGTGVNPNLPGNVLNPIPPPASTPGPTGTTPPGSNTQQSQTPPNNQSNGTQNATAPAEPGTAQDKSLRTWDEWNWFAEQRTGVPGPDPFVLGVSDRNALMSYAQWYAIYNPWFQSRGAGLPGTGGGDPNVGNGGNDIDPGIGGPFVGAVTYNTIFAAIAAILGFRGGVA